MNKKITHGGSLCKTEVIESSTEMYVRKSGRGLLAQKLESQGQWLKKYGERFHSPEVQFNQLNISEAELCVSYLSDSLVFSDWLKKQSTQEAYNIIEKIVLAIIKMETDLGKSIDRLLIQQVLNDYFKVKVAGKLNELQELLKTTYQDTFLFNDDVVLNGTPLNSLIMSEGEIYKKLFKLYAQDNLIVYPVHGDFTFENILIKNNQWHVIDPNPENILCDLAVELSKLYQSCHGYYEALANLKISEVKDGFIRCDWPYDEKLEAIRILLDEFILKKFGIIFLQKVRLHEIIHFVRLLPYKARVNPEAFLIMELRTRYLIQTYKKDFQF